MTATTAATNNNPDITRTMTSEHDGCVSPPGYAGKHLAGHNHFDFASVDSTNGSEGAAQNLGWHASESGKKKTNPCIDSTDTFKHVKTPCLTRSSRSRLRSHRD
jgi:hypothetical protein